MSWLITPQQKMPVDPYLSQVSLLLHGDGANGSTTITDSSPTPKTVTVNGGAAISTAQSRFGGSSLIFTGSLSDYLTVPNNDFVFGSANFTIEMWYYPQGSGARGLVGNYLTNGFEMYCDNNSKVIIDLVIGGVEKFKIGATAISNNTWHHLAFVRNSTDILLFVNGALDGTLGSVSGSQDVPSAPIRIGSLRTGVNADGYIDDLRITKGVARYTANFTPPTAPFPDI